MLKYLLGLFLIFASLQATTITSKHPNYSEGALMTFAVTEMSGDNQDWIGIYPVGSSNAWENVVAWRWSGGKIDGDIGVSGISAGNYEVRAFFHNSFITEATDTFTVGAQVLKTTISTPKSTYSAQESITVTLANMLGDSQDWVGIYPVGTDNSWANVVAWSWTGGIVEGDIRLGGLPEGTYEARAFFENSYHLEALSTFSVTASPTITMQKEHYDATEALQVSLSNMSGDPQDWVGIYPAGSDNSWNNVVAWTYTNGILEGTVTLDGVAAGAYEARVFFKNSYHLEGSVAFSVLPEEEGAKIFLIGDSTVHNDSTGEMGWGSQLESYMRYPNNIYNRARSGASSKSYQVESSSEHDWPHTKALMAQSHPHGAYLFIQFGHNDEKDNSALHTEPGRYNSYYNNLKMYVDKARELGVTPVLITSVERMYKGSYTHGTYPQTVKYLAEDENVLLLDLQEKSFDEFNQYASDAAIQSAFAYDDHTHFDPEGALIVAGWVKTLICNTDAALCQEFE